MFSFEAVVVDEEVFELLDELFREVVEFFDVGVHVVGLGDGDEAVVADAFFAVDLLAADDADEARGDEAARESGLVHEKENVDGIAVVGEGAGEEAEVVGKDHAGGESVFEGEDFLVGVEAEFVAAALGGFDDDLDPALELFIEWCQACRVSENAARFDFLRHRSVFVEQITNWFQGFYHSASGIRRNFRSAT